MTTRRLLCRSFVGALIRLTAVGVNWHEGEFDGEAAEAIEASCGRMLTKEEFHQHIRDTFGSFDAALGATCPLTEVRHTPLVLMSGPDGRDRLVGLRWIPAEESHTGTFRRFLVNEVDVPDAPDDDGTSRIYQSRLWEHETQKLKFEVRLEEIVTSPSETTGSE